MKIMQKKITFRVEGGWSEKVLCTVANYRCPIATCEAKLFVAPHGGVYCDNVHTQEELVEVFA